MYFYLVVHNSQANPVELWINMTDQVKSFYSDTSGEKVSLSPYTVNFPMQNSLNSTAYSLKKKFNELAHEQVQ